MVSCAKRASSLTNSKLFWKSEYYCVNCAAIITQR